jgi:hypothetical protein
MFEANVSLTPYGSSLLKGYTRFFYLTNHVWVLDQADDPHLRAAPGAGQLTALHPGFLQTTPRDIALAFD